MFELILHLLRSPFRSRQALILENVALRHKLQVLGRSNKRPDLKNRDRADWILLCRVWKGWRRPLDLVQPETVIRWHRRGFRAFWRRKSQRRSPGRPSLDRSERELIRQIAHDNPTWGAPRIHGELLKLGIFLSPTTVAKYMKRTRPPSQGWRTFLKNHAEEFVSVDFFTVPTLTCQVLYVFLMVHNVSRRIVHIHVTAHPTLEERLIGTTRRECLDYVIVLSERHLSRVLTEFVEYYNESRTHVSLAKDCPVPRAMQRPEVGPVRQRPMVGGLHHRYYREAA